MFGQRLAFNQLHCPLVSHFQKLVENVFIIIKPSKELNEVCRSAFVINLISYSYIESKSHVEVNQAIIGG